MLSRNNARPGLAVEHVPSGKRGELAQPWGVGWLARDGAGRVVEDDDQDAATPGRAGCFVEFPDGAPTIAPAPDVERRKGWRDEEAPASWVAVPFDELRLPMIECAAPASLARDGASGKCGAAFRPDEPDVSFCPSCAAVQEERDAKERARRLRALKARAKVARRAMPRLAAWCRKVDRAGRVEYLIPRVARSGMSRWIELFACGKDGADVCWPDTEPDTRDFDRLRAYMTGKWKGCDPAHDDAARAYALKEAAREYRETFRRLPGWSWKRRCFVVGGCGMDMVFATVDHLGDVFGFENWGNKIHRSGLSRAE